MKMTARTFAEFAVLTRKFGEGYLPLLIIVGSAGLSKSRTMAAVAPDARLIQGGNLSAFGFYLNLYEYKDQNIIIDDIDALYTDKACIRLLKSVCQTEPVKTVGWHTASKKLPQDANGNPVKEFQTTSKICIIANEWRSLNKNVDAVGDRGLLLTFMPDAEEVHNHVAKWFADKEILAFFKKHLDEIGNPSMRSYVNAAILKKAGLDWQATLLQNWKEPISPELAMEKLAAMKGVREQEKEVLFAGWTGYQRASYYRYKKEMKL